MLRQLQESNPPLPFTQVSAFLAHISSETQGAHCHHRLQLIQGGHLEDPDGQAEAGRVTARCFLNWLGRTEPVLVQLS